VGGARGRMSEHVLVDLVVRMQGRRILVLEKRILVLALCHRQNCCWVEVGSAFAGRSRNCVVEDGRRVGLRSEVLTLRVERQSNHRLTFDQAWDWNQLGWWC